MSNQKKVFTEFLQTLYPEDFEYFLGQFEKYHAWLVDTNNRINLISRKMDPEEYWTLHFLDSILPVGFIDFFDKKIIDFGCGGGLPGIPLKILHPSSELTFIDSTTKKIAVVKEGVEHLGLDGCNFIAGRLEELPATYHDSFDMIVSRSVRMLPTFKKKMLSLIGEGGQIILFKGREYEDAEVFDDFEVHDVSRPEIGERHIIEIYKLDSIFGDGEE